MDNALTRRIGFSFLAVISVASFAAGGAIVFSELPHMNTALLNNTASAADVYVGQSLVVVGAALLAAGILGGIVTVATSLLAPRQLVAAQPAPAATELADAAPTDVTDDADDVSTHTESDSATEQPDGAESEDVDQTRAVPVA